MRVFMSSHATKVLLFRQATMTRVDIIFIKDIKSFIIIEQNIFWRCLSSRTDMKSNKNMKNNIMKVALAMGLGAVVLAAQANAGVNVVVNVGGPAVVPVAPAPVVVAPEPAPVVVAPAPVVVAPAPPPVVVAPAPPVRRVMPPPPPHRRVAPPRPHKPHGKPHHGGVPGPHRRR